MEARYLALVPKISSVELGKFTPAGGDKEYRFYYKIDFQDVPAEAIEYWLISQTSCFKQFRNNVLKKKSKEDLESLEKNHSSEDKAFVVKAKELWNGKRRKVDPIARSARELLKAGLSPEEAIRILKEKIAQMSGEMEK